MKFLFTAFLLASFFNLILRGGSYSDISFAQGGSLVLYLCLIFGISLCLAAVEVFVGKYKPVEWLMLLSSIGFSLGLVSGTPAKIQHHLYAGVVVVMAIIINYLVNNGIFDMLPENVGKKGTWGIIAVFAIGACAVVGAIGVYRYLTYAAPNYDFGIWCNMFHNMKETGVPNTTCERDVLLSHFAVHFSPIYYLMLPLYFVFPFPQTLQVLQTLILYSGVVPLCIMAKNKGLSDRATVALGAVYAFFPAIATGTFYDLHENCFLLPLLLWCFCFFEKRKYIPMSVFAALVLLVKEDAFIYLLIFAVYVFFLEKKKKVAIILAASSLLYFIVVSSLMGAFGNGIMVGRYDNLIADSSDGLFGVVKTAVSNPGYLMTQLFVAKDGDNSKILYVFQLLLPLAFVPFATRKISRYILIAPVLMNIITMYVYQPNIRFQYSFGITAFLFYVAVLNLSELGEKTRKYVLSLSSVAALLMFAMLAVGNLGYYSQRYEKEKESYQHMDYVLEQVLPEDASVACSAFILPHIADRAEIYEVEYHKENGQYKTDTEYVVLDTRYKENCENAMDYYLENGYGEYHNDGGYVIILKKK